VEVGVFLPHVGPLASPTFVPAYCRRLEEAGFDGLWTVEHLAVPREMGSAYTLARRPVVVSTEAVRATMGLNLEMTTTLAVAAAVTTRVRLGTSVAVLPLHNPVLNARQIATVDLYSGGRVIYGVGVGWLEEEAAAMGMPWDHRGARSDEHIALLRALWTAEGADVAFDGRYYSFPAIDPNPRPTRSVPVLIGGHSDAAIERTARLGDGWIGSNMGPERLADALASLRAACARHDRDPAELFLVTSAAGQLDVGDGADGVVDALRRYEELGIHHLQVRVGGASEASALDALARWGDEVLPRLR
jgi:probable F420-dependent oxidoreductase